MGDLLPVGHELTRYLEGECSGHSPSHQIRRGPEAVRADEPQVSGRYFFQRIGQRGISDRWIEHCSEYTGCSGPRFLPGRNKFRCC